MSTVCQNGCKGITSATVKEIKGVLGKFLVIPERLSSSDQGAVSQQALVLTGLDLTGLICPATFPLSQAEAWKAMRLRIGTCSDSAATSWSPQSDMSGHGSQRVSVCATDTGWEAEPCSWPCIARLLPFKAASITHAELQSSKSRET